MHLAVGTSLAAMSFSTLSATIAQLRHRHVLIKPLLIMILPAICGAILGSFLSTMATGKTLKYIFGGFEVVVAVYYFFKKPAQKGHIEARYHPPLLVLGAFLIGMVGAFLGIGGGLFVTPLLILLANPIRNAIGTASCMSFVITLTAAINHFLFARAAHFNSVYTPAWIAVAITAVIGAPIGAILLKRLPEKRLRQFFALLLLAAAVSMFANR